MQTCSHPRTGPVLSFNAEGESPCSPIVVKRTRAKRTGAQLASGGGVDFTLEPDAVIGHDIEPVEVRRDAESTYTAIECVRICAFAAPVAHQDFPS